MQQTGDIPNTSPTSHKDLRTIKARLPKSLCSNKGTVMSADRYHLGAWPESSGSPNLCDTNKWSKWAQDSHPPHDFCGPFMKGVPWITEPTSHIAKYFWHILENEFLLCDFREHVECDVNFEKTVFSQLNDIETKIMQEGTLHWMRIWASPTLDLPMSGLSKAWPSKYFWTTTPIHPWQQHPRWGKMRAAINNFWMNYTFDLLEIEGFVAPSQRFR